jgi:ATP-dependent Zn protease
MSERGKGKGPVRRTELECTAYHEAGHAVAAFALGRGVRHVSIEPDLEKGSLGHCRKHHLPSLKDAEFADDTPRHRTRMEREIICFFAGGIAERHFRGRRNNVGASRDLTAAVSLAECLCGSLKETEAYLNWLYIRAENLVLVQHHWAGVQRMAKELLAHRILTGRQAREAYVAGINDAVNEHVRKHRRKEPTS